MRDRKELIEDWLAHMPQGDFEGFAGSVSPDFVLRLPFMPPGLPTEFVGRASAEAALQGSARGRAPLVFMDKTILGTEDPELFVATARAETTMADGRPYRNRYVIFVRLQDNTVIEHIEYLNPLALMDRG